MESTINNHSILQKQNIAEMEKTLFDSSGRLIVLPSSEYKKYTHDQIRYFGYVHGIYQFPTHELIMFLSDIVVENETIEICAGNGAIGRALDIKTTDSWMQDNPEVKAVYSE